MCVNYVSIVNRESICFKFPSNFTSRKLSKCTNRDCKINYVHEHKGVVKLVMPAENNFYFIRKGIHINGISVPKSVCGKCFFYVTILT